MAAITFPPAPAIVRSAEGIERPVIQNPVAACGAATLGVRLGKPPLPSPDPRFLQAGAQLPTHFHPENFGLRVFERFMNGNGTVQRADVDALCFSVAFPATTNVSFSLTVNAAGAVWMENNMPAGAGDFFSHTTHHIRTAVQPLASDDPCERVFMVPAYEEVDEKDNEAKRKEWEAQVERAKQPGQSPAPPRQRAPKTKTVEASRLTVRYPADAIVVTFRGNTVTLRLPAAK